MKIKTFFKKYSPMILGRFFLPYSLYHLINNFIVFWNQRKLVKQTLENSTQEFVDKLDDYGFYLETRSYTIKNFQIIDATKMGVDNLHPETIKRHLLSSLKEVFDGYGAKILSVCSYNIEFPTEKIIYIDIRPSRYNAFLVSLIDFVICFTVCLSAFFLYYYFY